MTGQERLIGEIFEAVCTKLDLRLWEEHEKYSATYFCILDDITFLIRGFVWGIKTEDVEIFCSSNSNGQKLFRDIEKHKLETEQARQMNLLAKIHKSIVGND